MGNMVYVEEGCEMLGELGDDREECDTLEKTGIYWISL